MNESEHRLFREYECRLDRHHKTLPLWDWPRPEAIYAVMTLADAILLPVMLSPTPPVMTGGVAQYLKGIEEGITQALRWLTEDGCITVQSTANEKLLKHAHEFCSYASDYVTIADLHMMHGRRWAEASVCAESETVTFDPVRGPGQSDALAWHEQIRGQSNRGMDMALKMAPSDISHMRHLFSSISYELVDGRIRFGGFPPNFVRQVEPALRHIHESEPLPLPNDADMLGFTIAEFWAFMEAATAWSHAAFMRYLRCASTGIPQHRCMPTQIVDEHSFVDQVTTMSELRGDTVRIILERLTYWPGRKSDILLTPFLRSEGDVCWSPAGIMKYRHERNLLKVMSRGSKVLREHAATVNGMRDRPLGRKIGERFAKYGYQFKLDTAIAAANDRTDIDVLLYHSSCPTEVLIIEAKALIPPDEISEVYDATQAILYAQDQVRRAMNILDSTSTDEKRHKFRFVAWEKVARIYGAVVTSDAEPHSAVDPRGVPVLTYGSLLWRYHARDFRRPSRFWQASVERPWRSEEIEEGLDSAHREFKVGRLTYRIPTSTVDINVEGHGIDKLSRLAQRTTSRGAS